MNQGYGWLPVNTPSMKILRGSGRRLQLRWDRVTPLQAVHYVSPWTPVHLQQQKLTAQWQFEPKSQVQCQVKWIMQKN